MSHGPTYNTGPCNESSLVCHTTSEDIKKKETNEPWTYIHYRSTQWAMDLPILQVHAMSHGPTDTTGPCNEPRTYIYYMSMEWSTDLYIYYRSTQWAIHTVFQGRSRGGRLLCCLTSTEAGWPIRDGDRVGKGPGWLARPRKPPEKDRRDRGPPPEQWKC